MDHHVSRRPALLNNASFGEPSEATLAAMRHHADLEASIGTVAARNAYDDAAIREHAAGLLGLSAHQVTFQNSTSEGWSKAVLSLPLTGTKALIAPWVWGPHGAMLQRLGLELIVMPMVTTDGAQPKLDLDRVATMIDESVAVISAPMMSSVTGVRVDVEGLGILPRPEHTWFLVDGAQAVGHVPLNCMDIGCDVFSATTRKWLRGPAGIALLGLSERMLAKARPSRMPNINATSWDEAAGTYRDVSDATRYETYDRADTVRVGLGAALDEVMKSGMDTRTAAILERADVVRRELRDQAGCTLIASECGIVTFEMESPELAAQTHHALRDAGMLISEPSISYEPWAGHRAGYLRVSPAAEASDTDIERMIEIIATRTP